MKKLSRVFFTVMSIAALSACDSDGPRLIGADSDIAPLVGGTPTVATGNIVQTAVDAGTFTVLAGLLGATGLDAVLADETRNFTVFAPNDEAFEALGADTINALQADPGQLQDILLYHVLADQNVSSSAAIALAGSSVQAANEDGLQLSLGNGNLFVNTAQVVAADVMATNGTIHVINEVLLPAAADSTDQPDGGSAPTEPTSLNIVDTALAAGSFNTLAAALEATDLISVLADENRSFTVFAPTDEAFDALGQETIDALLADPDQLRDILLYHVIDAQVVDANTAISLAGTTVTTANGDSIALSLDAGNLLVNASLVTATDIAASNGVIHVIDAVLLPPADEPPVEVLSNLYDTAVAAGNFTTLLAALQATGLDQELVDGHETYTVFAPTDDAFAALGAEAINGLLADPDTLSNILLYHLISGPAIDAVTAISLAGTQVTMANGDPVDVSLKNGKLFLNDARVIVTDVRASNGIIHVLDTVLIPH